MAHLDAVNTLDCAHRLIPSLSILAGGGVSVRNELLLYMDGWKLHISPVQLS